jgi:GTP-binding protein
MLKVTQSEFVTSAVKPEQYPNPDALPEIALVGRSNVGKSSFINKLINRRNLARTSSKPGKTQTLNFYLINQSFYFVDLPGYGFAQVSKAERAAWGKMIETYLSDRPALVIQLVDLRHPPSSDDKLMHDWLTHFDFSCKIVATKADKVPRGKWEKHKKRIREDLGMDKSEEIILFSAQTGDGKEAVWKWIVEQLPAIAAPSEG